MYNVLSLISTTSAEIIKEKSFFNAVAYTMHFLIGRRHIIFADIIYEIDAVKHFTHAETIYPVKFANSNKFLREHQTIKQNGNICNTNVDI